MDRYFNSPPDSRAGIALFLLHTICSCCCCCCCCNKSGPDSVTQGIADLHGGGGGGVFTAVVTAQISMQKIGKIRKRTKTKEKKKKLHFQKHPTKEKMRNLYRLVTTSRYLLQLQFLKTPNKKNEIFA